MRASSVSLAVRMMTGTVLPRAELAQDLQTAQFRQREIEDHQRVLFRAQHVIRVVTGVDAVDGVAFGAQRLRHPIGELPVVLDEQEPHRSGFRAPGPAPLRFSVRAGSDWTAPAPRAAADRVVAPARSPALGGSGRSEETLPPPDRAVFRAPC